MKKFIFTLLLLNCYYASKSQTKSIDTISWLNENVTSLEQNYLKKISQDLTQNTLIGLGEASHGTEEFFREKNRIVKFLIENQNYTKVGIEFSNQYLESINDYVTTGRGNLKSIMHDFSLYKTKAFYDLFEWIKKYNETVKKNKIEVFGFDDVDFTDPFTRDSLMAINVINRQKQANAKIILWGHNLHLAKDKLSGYKAMGYYLNKQYHNNYFNIAFDTYEGSVNTISLNQDETIDINSNTLLTPVNNFSAMFSKVKYDKFYICFKDDNPLIGIKNTFTNIWADWREPFSILTKFDSDFNAVIFMRKTSASILLY